MQRCEGLVQGLQHHSKMLQMAVLLLLLLMMMMMMMMMVCQLGCYGACLSCCLIRQRCCWQRHRRLLRSPSVAAGGLLRAQRE
jgi:hypothetical protein